MHIMTNSSRVQCLKVIRVEKVLCTLTNRISESLVIPIWDTIRDIRCGGSTQSSVDHHFNWFPTAEANML